MHEQLKYNDITEKIVESFFEVYQFQENGFQEVIYQKAWPVNFIMHLCHLLENFKWQYFIKIYKNPLKQDELILLWKARYSENAKQVFCRKMCILPGSKLPESIQIGGGSFN